MNVSRKINSHISTNEGSLISLQTMKKNRIQRIDKNSNLLLRKHLSLFPQGLKLSKSYLQWPVLVVHYF